MIWEVPRIVPWSLIIAKRYASTSVIGKQISTPEELREFLSKSSWSTQDLLNLDRTGMKIDKKLMDGLLDLTGLRKSLNDEDQSKLMNSLNDQLQFLDRLHSIDIPKEEEKDLKLTRLVDDASEDGMLDFHKLNSEVDSTKPDFLKGEVEDTWNPISLTKEHDEDYYIVKEGLIKKNKA
ncbi:DEKNAAC102465 [Brettanomyces naardenensis]|uniref:DEKNAAC102465 n=1 Tax=Brettanomyces naardenensis TaxID=13370 RepID=A0A448YK69_BRENA|nr:DEKNAAC102465 [Brettanomyces naardenensis]